jgi:hypothetical protein
MYLHIIYGLLMLLDRHLNQAMKILNPRKKMLRYLSNLLFILAPSSIFLISKFNFILLSNQKSRSRRRKRKRRRKTVFFSFEVFFFLFVQLLF